MDLFLIIISCVFVALLIVALILWIVESHVLSARKKFIGKKMAGGRGMRLDVEDVCLKVTDGTVEVLDSAKLLAAMQIEAEEPKAEAETPAEEKPEKVSVAVTSAADDEAPDQVPVPIGPDDERLALLEGYVYVPEPAVAAAAKFCEDAGKTFAERYAALIEKRQAYLDEIVAYILSCSDCSREDTQDSVIFRCRSEDLAYATINYGTPAVTFMLHNASPRPVGKGGTKTVKVTPVVVRLKSNADLILAKQIACVALSAVRNIQLHRS